MSETSLAQPAHLSTTRTERGLELYREQAQDFVHRHGAWLIASETVAGRLYEVRLGPTERCECSDFEFRGGRCKHIAAASIAQAKSRVCSCCGHRVLGRFATEVQEEDELLSWFAGDVLCATCISEGFWT